MINPKIIAANPSSGDSARYIGAVMKIKAPNIIKKNPPLRLVLLYSLCAIILTDGFVSSLQRAVSQYLL